MTEDCVTPEYLAEVRRLIWFIERIIDEPNSPLTRCQILDAVFSVWIHYAMEYNQEQRTIEALPLVYERLCESRKGKLQ